MDDLYWETTQSPIGTLVLLGSEAEIARIAWDCEDPQALAESQTALLGSKRAVQGWSPALLDARNQLEAWFRGGITKFSITLAPDPRVGDAFANRVLAATAAIPYGETRTYAEVAAAAGQPAGARAAGNALGANTIPVVVPCHRVVAANGLGGFGGGPERKQRLLDIESQ
jgi:methylated-DNA-[protein]-cysteine S-methyltransferase